MSAIYTVNITSAEADIDEILRYAAIPKEGRTPELYHLAKEALRLCEGKLKSTVCYAVFPVTVTGNTADVGFARWESESFAKYLGASREVLIFAATVGLELDRMITATGTLSPHTAHMLEAVGTERVEALCDAFCGYAEDRVGTLKGRFSPGYGDLSLEAQCDIFRALEPARRIGLSLTESMMMSPSKSVTAICAII